MLATSFNGIRTSMPCIWNDTDDPNPLQRNILLMALAMQSDARALFPPTNFCPMAIIPFEALSCQCCGINVPVLILLPCLCPFPSHISHSFTTFYYYDEPRKSRYPASCDNSPCSVLHER